MEISSKKNNGKAHLRRCLDLRHLGKRLIHIIIAMVFLVAATVASQAQDTANVEKVTKTEIADSSNVMDYARFKSLKDSQMADFLKERDAESYNMFRNGEIQRKKGMNMFISGLAVTGAGAVVLVGWFGVTLVTTFVGLFSLNQSILFFLDSWVNARGWFTVAGVSAIVIGIPFTVCGVKIFKQGGRLKDHAIDNYKNKHFSNETSLNFNLCPNAVGVTLKF